MKIKITLLTTEGCQSCRIMTNILAQIKDRNTAIDTLAVYNYTAAPDFIKQNVSLTDFPTTILHTDNKILKVIVGTKSVLKINDEINFLVANQ